MADQPGQPPKPGKEKKDKSKGWTRIHEYRIIVPTNLAQFRIGSRYMANRVAREDKGGGEGIEVRENRPFEDGERQGTYTYKIYHFKSRIPSAIRWAIPTSYQSFHEEAWNCYPHYLTNAFCPGKETTFYIRIESQHFEYHFGDEIPDNPVSLDALDLQMRKIFYLDIVGLKPKPTQPEFNLFNFVCPEAGIHTPLSEPNPKEVSFARVPKWVENYTGDLVLAVKVVRFRFNLFGLSTAVHHSVMDKFYGELFTNTHRQLISWAKEWFPMSYDDLLAYEAETERLQQEYFAQCPPSVDGDEGQAEEASKGKKKRQTV
jgi:hypothetical protein